MSYKATTEKCTVADAVNNGYSELQCLRDEVREWADNMEGNNLGSTPKYEEVSACADQLDSVADDEPEVPEGISGAALEVTQMVNTRKGRAPSRATRRDNAVAYLICAREAAEERSEALGKEKDDLENQDPEDNKPGDDAKIAEIEQEIEALEELQDSLQNAVDEAEAAEFPGMY